MKFYKHPKYESSRADWEQYRAYYVGDRSVLLSPNNLWMHEFENNAVSGGDILRKIREQRTRYVNLCGAIVQKYVSLVFQNRSDYSKVFDILTDEERQNINGEGISLESYVQQKIATDYFVYGKTIDEVTSDPDGSRVFLRHWTPQEVVDWQVSSGSGEYVMQYSEIAPRASLFEKPTTVNLAQYLHVTEGGYTVDIYRIDAGEATPWESVTIPRLDSVPVVVLEGESWVARILPILMSRYNLQSALDNILNYQAHQKILVAGDFQPGDGLIMNEAGVTFVREGSTITVVDPSNPSALVARLEAATADLWRVAFFQSRTIPTDSRVAESSLTIRAVKEDLLNAIQGAGEAIANHANNLMVALAKYKGQDIGIKPIEFDFEIVIDDEEFYRLAALFMEDIKPYDTWRKEVYKRVAKRMNLQNLDAVNQEIQTKQIQAERLSLSNRLVDNAEA